MPEIQGHRPVDVLDIVLPSHVGRVENAAAPGHDLLLRLRREVGHHLALELDALPLLEHLEHRLTLLHLLRDELRLDRAGPERDHSDPGLLELVPAVCRHPVTASLAHTIGHIAIEQVPTYLESSSCGVRDI